MSRASQFYSDLHTISSEGNRSRKLAAKTKEVANVAATVRKGARGEPLTMGEMERVYTYRSQAEEGQAASLAKSQMGPKGRHMSPKSKTY